jgi:beta-glucosidase
LRRRSEATIIVGPMERSFPAAFVFGCATSAHQVEGGNQANDWWAWEAEPGRIAGDERSGDACAWWRGHAETDLTLAAELGQNAHRLSLEWSRLEPEPGRYDAAAFDRYAHLLAHLRRLNMRAMVTLHHFALPRWVGAAGWTDPALPSRFARLAGECARRLGALVDWWATINEPLVLAFMAYFGRTWPPGHGSVASFARVVRQLRQAHQLAFASIHRERAGAQVGIALNLPLFEPARPHDLGDRAVTRVQHFVFNEMFLRAIARQCDFIGLNYYGRYLVRFDLRAAGQMFGRHVQRPTVRTPRTDWGQIHPSGLVEQLSWLSRFGRPLYVTENGVFDNEDRVRQAFLRDHLSALLEALRRGLDVRGYFHWTLVDNFEWAEGYGAHFGLIAVDRRTQARTPKPSAEVYERICRTRSLQSSVESRASFVP